MVRFNEIMISVIFLIFYMTVDLQGFSLDRVKRDTDGQIADRLILEGRLNFTTPILAEATQPRRIACFFVFDKGASAELNNNIDLAKAYATQLAYLASKYTASINTVVTNAGTEIWAYNDRIPFAIDPSANSILPGFVTQFQKYLNETYREKFGRTYAVGVLISYGKNVTGGYSQAPACTTSGVSLLSYRPIPWNIGGLFAHELVHTLHGIHPNELPYYCATQENTPEFCKQSSTIPPNCACNTDGYPSKYCLMTQNFGAALDYAPKYTSCDIQMINYYAPTMPCLTQ